MGWPSIMGEGLAVLGFFIQSHRETTVKELTHIRKGSNDTQNTTNIIISEWERYFEDYRPSQPLYNRVVYRNFPEELLSRISDHNCCSNNFAETLHFLMIILLTSFVRVNK